MLWFSQPKPGKESGRVCEWWCREVAEGKKGVGVNSQEALTW